ncbi:uncharacterized protein LOC131953043 isoform X3 [Physella acuta]|uniref:uncharacterized protein LOC131953043 isoform X3 n=1 Tax=Physella acuta TaxID=109671 RepID=UPI0027DE26D9|nr:uncharacterized protein LOC131953043 isoform X3 [Physella acuta]
MRNVILYLTLCSCLWVFSTQGVKWFGPSSQYMCHCEDDQCDDSGQCVNGSKCARGWFGIKCQYVDLASGLSDVLTDGDDSTCTSDTDIAIVDLREEFPFTWLRLTVIDPDALRNLRVSFLDFQNPGALSVIQCSGMKLSYINSKTLDIRCDLSVLVQQVVVSGDGVRSLCSLYVSGAKYKGICCPERLQKFKLQSYSSSGVTLFTYKEPGTVETIYNISTATLQENVAKVQISESVGPYLTLCEVEIYGECPVGTWGLTCENNCSRNCYETSCHRETGECDNGCQGFEDPPECTNVCLKGFYGHNCKKTCSPFCLDHDCDPVTGDCTTCKPGDPNHARPGLCQKMP